MIQQDNGTIIVGKVRLVDSGFPFPGSLDSWKILDFKPTILSPYFLNLAGHRISLSYS